MIHLTPFAVSGLLIVITYFPLIWVLFLKGRSKASFLLSLHMTTVFLWGINSFLIGANQNYALSFLLWKLAFISVTFVPVSLFHAVLVITNKYSKYLVATVYLQGIFFLYIALTGNMFHQTKLIFNSFYYLVGDSTIYHLYFLTWVTVIIVSYIYLLEYYKKTYPREKRQMLFLMISMAIGLMNGTTNFLPALGFNVYPYWNFLVPSYSLILIYAILRHQLFDIEVVIRKSVVYSLAITAVTVIYLIIVVLLEKFFQGVIGYSSMVATALFAFAIGLIFIPLRNRIQYFIDRLFFKGTTAEIAQQNELLLKEVAKTERMRAVSILASGMAHEIKNPLTAIKTFSEFLPQKKNDPQFLEKYARIVGGEAQRINDLVHQLLDMAKPAPPQIQKINIHLLIDNLLDFLSSEFIRRRIRVVKEYKAQDFILDLDPNQLRQVFLNLFMNAADAMKGGGTLMISAYLRSSGASPSAIICVKDTGCGISPRDLPHIFEPFFSKKVGGTGLGLSVVQEIIEEHKGKIKVESEAGKGTAFTIELPVSIQEEK